VTGTVARGMLVVISGEGEIKRRDPPGHLAPIVTHRPNSSVSVVAGRWNFTNIALPGNK
jgi:hypothetical protein